MTFQNLTYTIPMRKEPVSDYVNDGVISKSALRDNQTTTLSSVCTPLIMSSEISMSRLGNSKNGFNATNGMGNGVINGSPRIPSVPNHPPPRVFTKQKAVNMNPMPSSNVQDNHRRGNSLTDPPRPNGLVEPPHRGISFPGAYPKSYDEDCDGGESDSYLTPIDPPDYMEAEQHCSSGELPISPTESELTGGRWRRDRTRFDSGMGDSESDQGSNGMRFSMSPSMTSSISMSNPRLSTHHEQHYEDIDKYSKPYQQVGQNQQPQKRGSTDKFQMSNNPVVGIRPLPQVNISGVTHSDSNDSVADVNISMAETISRPLNDQVLTVDDRVATLPHTYTPLNTKKYSVASVTPPARGKCCFLAMALIAVFLISLTALVISVYVLCFRSDESSTNSSPFVLSQNASEPDPNLNQILADLQNQISMLKKENIDLKAALSQQETKLTSFVQPLQENVSQLSSQQQFLSNNFQVMEDRLVSRIANVSLTPGPQGPPGIANYSLCQHLSVSGIGSATDYYKTETNYLPSEDQAKSYFVTFAYCTYTGAAGGNLETSADLTRYRCSCFGTYLNEKQTVCTLNVWICPRTT